MYTDEIQGSDVKSDSIYYRIYIKSDNLENITSVALSWGTHYYQFDTMHMDIYAATTDFESKDDLKEADMSQYTKLGETWFRKPDTWGYYYPEVTISNEVPENATGIIVDLYVIGDADESAYVSTIYQKTIGLYYSAEEESGTEPTPIPTDTPDTTPEPGVVYIGDVEKVTDDTTEADINSVGFRGEARVTGTAHVGFRVTAQKDNGEQVVKDWTCDTVITSEDGATSVVFGLLIADLDYVGLDRDNVTATYLQ